MKTENTQIVYLDLAKAIAIILVVWGHVLGSYQGIWIGLIGFVHMPVFFLISGYLSTYSFKAHEVKQIFKSKTFKLLFPYIVWSTASWVFNVICGHNSTEEFIQIFLYARSIWFLVVLYFIFCLNIFSRLLSKKCKVNVHTINIILWILCILFVPNRFFSLYKLKLLFPFFELGSMISEYKKEKLLYSTKNIIFVLFYIVMVIFTYEYKRFDAFILYNLEDLGMYYTAIYYLISLSGTLGVLFICKILSEKLSNNVLSFLQWIGKNSMDIYLIHMFFVSLIHLFVNIENIILSLICALLLIILILLFKAIILDKIAIYRFCTGKGKNS